MSMHNYVEIANIKYARGGVQLDVSSTSLEDVLVADAAPTGRVTVIYDGANTTAEAVLIAAVLEARYRAVGFMQSMEADEKVISQAQKCEIAEAVTPDDLVVAYRAAYKEETLDGMTAAFSAVISATWAIDEDDWYYTNASEVFDRGDLMWRAADAVSAKLLEGVAR